MMDGTDWPTVMKSVTCDRLVGYGGRVRWAVLDERLGGFLEGDGVGGRWN
jgi:hypothetical protein